VVDEIDAEFANSSVLAYFRLGVAIVCQKEKRKMPYKDKVVNMARRDAIAAHHGQTRDDGVTPYFVHCNAVAALVSRSGGTPYAVAAALLHDVIEDTEFELKGYPARVMELVHKLTNTEKGKTGNKKRAIEKLRGDSEAILIKIADRVHNLGDTKGAEMLTWKSVRESTRLLITIAFELNMDRGVQSELLFTLDAILRGVGA